MTRQHLVRRLYLQLVFISAYLYFEFLVAFLDLKRRWYINGLRYTGTDTGLHCSHDSPGWP